MYASVSNLLLSNAGPMGIELIRSLYREALGPVTRFVTVHDELAQAWVGVAPHVRAEPLTKAQLGALLGASGDTPETKVQKVSELASQLGVSERELMSVADQVLFQAVQMAAPDGMRVSMREAKRLDDDLRNAVGVQQQTVQQTIAR
jgi:hypothetical protein